MRKAITKDSYRPRNISIVRFALDKDLDSVNGPFNTFDKEFGLTTQKTPEKIRERFKIAMLNLNLLAKKFTLEWISRLNKHRDLVEYARGANKYTEVAAYQMLFNALTKDFCMEYDCDIISKVITDWSQAPVKKQTADTGGRLVKGWALRIPKGLSEYEKQVLSKEFSKSPSTHPYRYTLPLVYININTIHTVFPDPTEFFYNMITAFVHEIHHALDLLHPEKTALGPQIQSADEKTYVNFDINKDEYMKSATECSSYKIQTELYNALKAYNF